jgi:hypothetical protein
LQELQIVDHEHVDAAQRFLERKRGLRAQRRDEAVHELLGGEIERLALGAVVAGPGDRLQQVGLAEADAGVDVERIEHHRIAAASRCDLLRRRVGQRVRAADYERIERQPQIERRAAERIMPARHRPERGAHVAAAFMLDAKVAPELDGLDRLLRRHRADHRAAHADVQLLHFGVLALPTGQQTLAVVRLDPALQEARRHRQMGGGFVNPVELHAREPALENLLADLRAQPALYTLPALLIRGCHFLCLGIATVEGTR